MRIRDDFTLIAATDSMGGIGKDNKLLARVPEDMRHFKEHTLGQTVVVGRKTFLGFKDAKPLPDRTNIVLSSDYSFHPDGCVVAHNLHELFDLVHEAGKRIYVVGGESIYRQLIGFCNRATITRFSATFEADTYLPEVSANTGWICIEEGEWKTSSGGIRYRFQEFIRQSAL